MRKDARTSRWLVGKFRHKADRILLVLDNFGVKATLDGDGVRALSRWVDDYGGGLVDDTWSQRIFGSYQPRWEGRYTGYNVMIDLGIFLGAYLISKRPRLQWEIYRGHAIEPEAIGSTGYMRPHLGGMPRGWACNILVPSYGRSWEAERTPTCALIGPRRKKMVSSGKQSLFFTCRTCLTATMP